MNLVQVNMTRLLSGACFFRALALLAVPASRVIAIEQERILKAAWVALKPTPVTITGLNPHKSFPPNPANQRLRNSLAINRPIL